MQVGYARISATGEGPDLEIQTRRLRTEGCEQVFAERVSYIGRVRPQLDHALRSVRRGDCLVAVSADRIARSAAELQWIVADLAARGIDLRILGNPGNALDTRSAVAQPMLTMLSLIADFELAVNLERQRERDSLAATKRLCRRSAPIAQYQVDETLRLAAQGTSKSAIARKIGVSLSSVYRIVRNVEQEQPV